MSRKINLSLQCAALLTSFALSACTRNEGAGAPKLVIAVQPTNTTEEHLVSLNRYLTATQLQYVERIR